MKKNRNVFDLELQFDDEDLQELFRPFQPTKRIPDAVPVATEKRGRFSPAGLKSGIMAGASMISGVIAVGQGAEPWVWILLFVLSGLFYRFWK